MEPSYYFFLSLVVVKSMTIKSIYYYFFVLFSDHPHSKNWTLDFEPAFLSGFTLSCARDSIFILVRGFPSHVTSGQVTSGDVISCSGHVTSGTGDVISGHVTSASGDDTSGHVTSG